MIKHMKIFLKPTRLHIILFLLLFFVSYFYMPTVKCLDDTAAKEKVCKLYGECETDYYYSLSGIVSIRNDWQEYCPASSMSYMKLFTITIILGLLDYLLACMVAFYYKKYRDI